MDINLPLILVIACFAGSIVWVYDLIALKPKREKAKAALQQSFPQWGQANSTDEAAYNKAIVNSDEPGWIKETKSFLPILWAVLILRSFLFEPFQIPSSSMEPTLDIGDFILVNKFTYGIRLPVIRTKVIDINQPEPGDVMVFFPPHDDRYFIKRVIGQPGDLVEYRNKVLFINGKEQTQIATANAPMDIDKRLRRTETLNEREHELFNSPRQPAQNRLPFCECTQYLVKEGEYFMMGDNRDNSHDSRFWGPVPEERIVGRAFAIWMHWKDWSSLPSFGRVGTIQ